MKIQSEARGMLGIFGKSSRVCLRIENWTVVGEDHVYINIYISYLRPNVGRSSKISVSWQIKMLCV